MRVPAIWPEPAFLQILLVFYNSRPIQGLHAVAHASTNIVLGHRDMLVAKKLLRLIHAAGQAHFGAGFRADVSELEFDASVGTCLFETVSQLLLANVATVVVCDQVGRAIGVL